MVGATWESRLGTTRVSSHDRWPSRSGKADRTGSRSSNGYQPENRPATNACRDLVAALFLIVQRQEFSFGPRRKSVWEDSLKRRERRCERGSKRLGNLVGTCCNRQAHLGDIVLAVLQSGKPCKMRSRSFCSPSKFYITPKSYSIRSMPHLLWRDP